MTSAKCLVLSFDLYTKHLKYKLRKLKELATMAPGFNCYCDDKTPILHHERNSKLLSIEDSML